jgi:phospholipid/cholesterol/gamma-HCH transport system substrate-binding protein
MQKSRHDVWIGMFVMLGAAAIVFLALKAGNLLSLSFDETYQVVARFDNIGGLKSGAAVKSAGVVVGRVESIGFDDKMYQASVLLQMQKRFVFPKDSSAKILTSGLLGEQYIGLEAGADEKTLVAGDTIKATQSAVVLENLISQFLFNKAADASNAPAPQAAPAPPAAGVKK